MVSFFFAVVEEEEDRNFTLICVQHKLILRFIAYLFWSRVRPIPPHTYGNLSKVRWEQVIRLNRCYYYVNFSSENYWTHDYDDLSCAHESDLPHQKEIVIARLY